MVSLLLYAGCKLEPGWYCCFLNFFQASSWDLSVLLLHWVRFLQKQIPLFSLNGSVLMVLDGIKISKEGLGMPGNKKLHQSSEN
jgi:hypothetical protein